MSKRTNDQPKLTILLPVYNEEKTIGQVLNKITRLPIDKYEVIIVNDGSSDKSDEIITRFTSKFSNSQVSLNYISHDKNRGKGAGIKTGLANAKGTYFTIQDADLEYDPESIPKLLNRALGDKLDVVYGSRFLGTIKNMPLANYYANRFYNLLLRKFYKTNISDMHTCYKLVKTRLLKSLDITSEGFNYAPELISKLLLRNIEIVEMPISYSGRNKAEGKKIGARDGIECTLMLFKYKIEASNNIIGKVYRERILTARYILIGSLGFVFNYAVLWMLTKNGLNRVIAEILAAAVALHVTFIFHDRWTYKDRALSYKRKLFTRYRTYFVSNSIGSLITILFFAVFSLFLNHLLSLALASFCGLFWNYIINKLIVWKHTPEPKVVSENKVQLPHIQDL